MSKKRRTKDKKKQAILVVEKAELVRLLGLPDDVQVQSVWVKKGKGKEKKQEILYLRLESERIPYASTAYLCCTQENTAHYGTATISTGLLFDPAQH